MYYKIIHRLIDLDPSDFFIFAPNPELGRGPHLRLHKSLCQSDVELNSFSNRAVNCWNELPSEMVTAKLGFLGFKYKLKNLDITEHCKGRE